MIIRQAPTEEAIVSEAERKQKLKQEREQERAAEQERLAKMQEQFNSLKQSGSDLEAQANKRLQAVGPHGFRGVNDQPSQEELVAEMEDIAEENKQKEIEAQKESEKEFEKNLDLKYRKQALGLSPEARSPYDSSAVSALNENIPAMEELGLATEGAIPYAPGMEPKQKSGRGPASEVEGLPKIESAPGTKQEALKDVKVQEAQAIKPEKRDLVEEALERVRQNRLAAAIQRSSAGLGAAIASVGALQKISPDEESLKLLEEGVERPTQELKFKQEQEKVQKDLADAAKMSDPNSDISVMTRSMLGQVGLSHLASKNVSAQDLKNAGIDVDSLLAKKIQMDQTAALREQTSAARQDARMSDMAARLAPKIQNKQFEEMAALNTQVGILKNAAANPNPQNDAAIIYSFVKALDPGSAVKEGEIAFTEAGRSIPNKIRQYLFKAATGQGLSPEERKNIIAFAENAAKVKTQIWKQSAQPYLNQAEKLGIPTNMVAPGLESLTKFEDTINKTPEGEMTVIDMKTNQKHTGPKSKGEKLLRDYPDRFKRVE